jgi:predicted nucleic acid-binding Zn ribbon protein
MNKKHPRALGSILDELKDQMRLSTRMEKARLPEVWSKVAGPEMSSVSEPVKINDGKLYVRVTGSVWRQEISLLRRDLIQRCQKELPNTPIEELVLL